MGMDKDNEIELKRPKRNAEVLRILGEERNLIITIKRRQKSWIGHI